MKQISKVIIVHSNTETEQVAKNATLKTPRGSWTEATVHGRSANWAMKAVAQAINFKR